MPSRSSPRKRILWIKADPLYPLDSGGRIRTFQMLKQWHRQHDVTYLSLYPSGTPDEARTHARAYSSDQTWVTWKDPPKRGMRFFASLLRNLLLSRAPYVIDKYRSAAAVAAISRLERERDFDLVIADFLSMAPNIAAAGVDPDKIVVFQHNVESQIWKRHFETASNPFVKAYMFDQWRRYVRFERRTCAAFRGVIAVSEDDAIRLRDEFKLHNVLGFVPTGVDVDFFAAVAHRPETLRIVFLGSMDWMPNIDGVTDFVREVFPRIRQACPGAKLTIVGRNPSPAVRSLQHPGSGVDVTGTVDDVRPHMSRAAVSVVPLRVGGGTRIKIFEAMAMGIPVVSSTIGAEGLPVEDGRHLYVADDPDTFARRVVALLRDAALARTMGEAGRQMVRERFSWRSAVDQFDRMCSEAVAPR